MAALAKIDRPSTFCTTGSSSAVLPGLDVDEMGTIGLPLTIKQAKELKRQCEQAPYGKGEDTIVDTRVRRVWRLSPDRFSLTNPAWKAFLQETVAKVQTELGLEGQQLKPHLYDLLLYETGSFFLPHRDGEKLDRMVATLVVALPSAHEGGKLIVRHEGQKEVVDFAGKEGRFQVQYAAFYADCEHEVKPLRSGYRLCLVYNLVLAKSQKPRRGKPIGAPRSLEHIAAIKDILSDWAGGTEAPRKLAVTLEHRYSRDGLAWDALKGVDRAKARVLAEAARQAGCQAHLALLTLYESGAAEYANYAPRRGRGWDRYDEDQANEHEMGEVFDSSLTARHWRGLAGDRLPFGAIPVERSEVVPEESLTKIKPKEIFEGYTGNAGMTLERWYRHAAVFVWPDRRHLEILCEGGSRQAVRALARMMSDWRKAEGAESATMKTRCLEFASMIMAQWSEHKYDYYSWRRPKVKKSPDLLACLAQLGDANLVRGFLRDVLSKDESLEPKAIAKAVAHFGWAAFRGELRSLFEATSSKTIERDVRMLERLCLAQARHAAQGDDVADARKTTAQLAECTVAALEMTDDQKGTDDWRMNRVERHRLLARLARALLAAELDGLLSQVVEHAFNHPNKYDVRRVHMQALTRLGPWLTENLKRRSPALKQWIAGARQRLELLTTAAPQPPADFRRDAKVDCDCKDCAELNKFLIDSRQHERGFQMAQGRRNHLESNIRSYHCDLDCTTDKRPRPQILVCTKNIASHERRVKEYHENLVHLTTLESLEAGLPE